MNGNEAAGGFVFYKLDVDAVPLGLDRTHLYGVWWGVRVGVRLKKTSSIRKEGGGWSVEVLVNIFIKI